MRTAVLCLLLAVIFGLLSRRAQAALRGAFQRRPWLLPAGAGALAAAFSAIAAASGAAGPLLPLASAYLVAPAALAWLLGAGAGKRPRALDFAIVALLWFPLEFGAGAQWVPRPAQGFLHSAAYGFSIILALLIFLCFRATPGMKYNLPRSFRDLFYPLAGFALAAPLLIGLGVWLGFMPGFHMPANLTAVKMASRFAVIFAATALPEEILFRALIQNLLMRRFGAGHRTLAAAALVFGASHLNNGPLPAPNWRYALVATLAGAAFGKVFQKSSTVLSPAGLHAMVNTAKHFFF
ncbi:MAG: lysostaphin resistance A-like protein [Bryobacteraceae bacterium]